MKKMKKELGILDPKCPLVAVKLSRKAFVMFVQKIFLLLLITRMLRN